MTELKCLTTNCTFVHLQKLGLRRFSFQRFSSRYEALTAESCCPLVFSSEKLPKAHYSQIYSSCKIQTIMHTHARPQKHNYSSQLMLQDHSIIVSNDGRRLGLILWAPWTRPYLDKTISIWTNPQAFD